MKTRLSKSVLIRLILIKEFNSILAGPGIIGEIIFRFRVLQKYCFDHKEGMKKTADKVCQRSYLKRKQS